MWELTARRIPYKTLSLDEILKRKKLGMIPEVSKDLTYVSGRVKHTPSHFVSLIHKCCSQSPDQRPTVAKILKTLNKHSNDDLLLVEVENLLDTIYSSQKVQSDSKIETEYNNYLKKIQKFKGRSMLIPPEEQELYMIIKELNTKLISKS